MRRALVATLGLIALSLCLCGAIGLWQLRIASTTSATDIFELPLLRLASSGLVPEDGQSPMELTTFVEQIGDRFLLVIATGLVLLILAVCLMQLTRRQNLRVVHAKG